MVVIQPFVDVYLNGIRKWHDLLRVGVFKILFLFPQ